MKVDRLKVNRLKADGKRLFNTSAFSLQPKYLPTIFAPALPDFCTFALFTPPSLQLEQACLKTWACIDLDITNIFSENGEST